MTWGLWGHTASSAATKDHWEPGETAHYEYHCDTNPDSSDYHLHRRTQQPITVLGLEPDSDDFSDVLPTLADRAGEGLPRTYRVRFGDGHEDTAWEDELLTGPQHFSPQWAFKGHNASRTAMPAWYHNTHNSRFNLDPTHEPANVAEEGDPTYGVPGVFVTQNPDEWREDGEASPYGYRVEFDGPEDMGDVPGAVNISHDGTSYWVPADQYHHLRQKQITPYKEAKLMTAAVTVYTQPNCPQCNLTKLQLQRLGIEHDTVDVTADPEAHAYVTGLGYAAAPVVVAGEDHWSGFRPDRLKGLAGGE